MTVETAGPDSGFGYPTPAETTASRAPRIGYAHDIALKKRAHPTDATNVVASDPFVTRRVVVDPQLVATRVNRARRPSSVTTAVRAPSEGAARAPVPCEPPAPPSPWVPPVSPPARADHDDYDHFDDDDFDPWGARRARWTRRVIAIGVVAGALWMLASLSSSPAEILPAPVTLEARGLTRVGLAPVGPQLVAEPSAAPAEVEATPARRVRRKAAPRESAETVRVFAAPAAAIPKTEVVSAPTVKYRDLPAEDRSPDGRARPNVLLWTVPGGAAVTVNGRFIGRTPVNVSWDLGAEPEIELALAGYETHMMTLPPGSSSGIVRVELSPQGDTVEVEEEFPDPLVSDDAMPEPTLR